MRTKVEWFLFWPTSLQISILWKEATINDLMITTERKRWDILLISLDLKLLYDEIQLVGLSQLYRENCEASVQVPSLLAKHQLYSLPHYTHANRWKQQRLRREINFFFNFRSDRFSKMDHFDVSFTKSNLQSSVATTYDPASDLSWDLSSYFRSCTPRSYYILTWRALVYFVCLSLLRLPRSSSNCLLPESRRQKQIGFKLIRNDENHTAKKS